MIDYQTKYESYKTNAQINASASETYFTSNEDIARQQLEKQSFNYLEIINDSSYDVYVDLDGLTTRRRILYGKAVMVLKAEEGIYFNQVKLTNTDGANNISADLIKVVAKIMVPVQYIPRYKVAV